MYFLNILAEIIETKEDKILVKQFDNFLKGSDRFIILNNKVYNIMMYRMYQYCIENSIKVKREDNSLLYDYCLSRRWYKVLKDGHLFQINTRRSRGLYKVFSMKVTFTNITVYFD